MRHAVVAALTAACAFLGLAAAADAQAGPNQQPLPFTITAAGQSSGVYNLSGQSSCAVVVYNSGSGLTLVPQATSDTIGNIATGAAQWTTVSAINSGSINTFGSYVGNVAATGLTGFRVTATTLSSGPVQGSLYCSNASSASGGGAVTGNVGLNAGSNTVGYVGLIGGSNTIGNVGVTGPLPAGTNALGSVTVANLASPAPYIAIGVNPSATATPAAFDANNNLNVGLSGSTAGVVSVVGALNAVTPPITVGGNGTLRYTTSGLTGTPFTVSYQGGVDGTTFPQALSCTVLGSGSQSYHSAQAGLESGFCDVSKVHYVRFNLTAFSGTAAGTLQVNYSLGAAAPPYLTTANGVALGLLVAGDTITNTSTGLPATSLNEIYNGGSYFTRMYSCTATASISLSGTTDTAVIAGVASKNIYVCAYKIELTGTTPTYRFSSAGTCGSSDNYFGTAIALTTGGIDQFAFGQNSGWNTSAVTQNLCLTLGGTSPVATGWVQYAQF